jgi:uncharacterized membrane protein
MEDIFLLCAVVGGVVLLAQVLLAVFGIDHDLPEPTAGLELLSVRALAAATTVFGGVGMALTPGLPLALAAGVALLPAGAAAAGTAWLTRMMLRLESDGSLKLDGASGQIGTVYTPIPGDGVGTGLVHFTLQGRTIELSARTRDGVLLPTGASVLVVSVDPETETAEVIPTPQLEGLQ